MRGRNLMPWKHWGLPGSARPAGACSDGAAAYASGPAWPAVEAAVRTDQSVRREELPATQSFAARSAGFRHGLSRLELAVLLAAAGQSAPVAAADRRLTAAVESDAVGLCAGSVDQKHERTL